MVIVSFNLLVDLHEQSSLRVVTQVELLAELLDDFDRSVAVIDADLLNILTVKLNLENANGLLMRRRLLSTRLGVVRANLRLVVSLHLGSLLELSRTRVHLARSVMLLRARLEERLLALIQRISLSLLRRS